MYNCADVYISNTYPVYIYIYIYRQMPCFNLIFATSEAVLMPRCITYDPFLQQNCCCVLKRSAAWATAGHTVLYNCIQDCEDPSADLWGLMRLTNARKEDCEFVNIYIIYIYI